MITFEITHETTEGNALWHYEKPRKSKKNPAPEYMIQHAEYFGEFAELVPITPPRTLADLEKVKQRLEEQYTIEEVSGLRPYPRLKLFCSKFLEYKKVQYKVSVVDSGKIKELDIDEALLDWYFKSDHFLFAGKQSIGNLAKYWNEVRAMSAQTKDNPNEFPNHFDAKYYAKLQGRQLMLYKNHLRNNCKLTPVKNQVGTITNWV